MRAFCCLILLISVLSCSQKSTKEIDNKKKYFSRVTERISIHRKDANTLNAKGDIENEEKQYDSIRNLIKGAYVNDYTFYDIDSNEYSLKNREKPILLLATASWCKPCISEIPALNKISKEYSDKIDIVLLFWDESNKLKKIVSRYDKNIVLIPSTKEAKNGYELNISGFSHILGFPTRYLVNKNKKIINYYTGGYVPYAKFTNQNGEETFFTEEEVFIKNYSKLKEEVNELLSPHS
ncbi:thioredoxin family protein [Aquimarina sp. RZ0]|uniref:TlpA family protein disulfide reductase n=1 Tax=Aquimarina sp. RZ0 TaxID=2607730 RepID=UPI0011F375D8|nr:thioredoxin family protein [Aquimarina sp. RZ0]KAA1243728.1 thioredoxin family protein [Aquimarina sp. RZ0]